MVKNKDYKWGPEAKLDEITVRYIGVGPAQVQALRNGEADIIARRHPPTPWSSSRPSKARA